MPLADQLGTEGTGLESLEIVVREGLRTALTLLITVPGVLEADGRAVERSRQAVGHTCGCAQILEGAEMCASFSWKSSSRLPWVSEVVCSLFLQCHVISCYLCESWDIWWS